MASRHDNELIGRIWCDRYEILELIGKGGMGTVYKARQIQIDREVALKVIHRKLTHDEKSVARFEKEARASSKLHHPNNIRVYDYGRSDDDRLFIAMECLTGQTLGDLIASEGPLTPQRVIHITRQIAKSLGEAHEVGLVHRDLKPENIFICDIHGEPDFVKVLDFGIAKAVGPGSEHANLTQTGFICGTPRYISPEQALGQPVDGRSDLYAVAVLMYEMLAGRPPFMGENPISIVMMHVYDDPPPLVGLDKYGEVGERLTRLISHMLQKNPGRRPASAEKVISFLDARIPEDQLVSRRIDNPLQTGAAPPKIATDKRIPTFEDLTGEGLPRFVNDSHEDMERTITSGSSSRRGTDESTQPFVHRSPDLTPSEAVTAFTSQPRALSLDTPGEVTDPDKIRAFATDTEETIQIDQGHLDEALKALKERKKPAKGLVRRRPSSTDNFPNRSVPVKRGPSSPTPTGATGLALRTIDPSRRRAPMWALVTMGVCIGIIVLSVGGFLISRLASPGTSERAESTKVAEDKPAKTTVAAGKNDSPKPTAAKPPQAPAVAKAPAVRPPIKKTEPASQPVSPQADPPKPAVAPAPATKEPPPNQPSTQPNPTPPAGPAEAAPVSPPTDSAPVPVAAPPFTGGEVPGMLLAKAEPPPAQPEPAPVSVKKKPVRKVKSANAKSSRPKRPAAKPRKKPKATGDKKKKKKKKKKKVRIDVF